MRGLLARPHVRSRVVPLLAGTGTMTAARSGVTVFVFPLSGECVAVMLAPVGQCVWVAARQVFGRKKRARSEDLTLSDSVLDRVLLRDAHFTS